MQKVPEQLKALQKAVNDIRTLQKMPIYDCGEDAYAYTVTDTVPEDFHAIMAYLADKGKAISRRIADNRMALMPYDGGYHYIYEVASRHEIRVVDHRGGQPIPEQLGEKRSLSEGKTLIQICPDDEKGNFGMGYLLCLGQGHFVIYDGNGDLDDAADKLYRLLLSHTPEGQKPIIDMWLVTHIHWDHVTCMRAFAKAYGDKVEVKNVVANIPAHHNIVLKERAGNTDFYAKWWPDIQKGFADAAFYKVHSGMRFSVYDVDIEVLFTHEDIPSDALLPNDTSVVTMMYVNGKKLFFPGDIQSASACQMLFDMYGKHLKSDYYQVAHHGWDTEALIFYDTVDAPHILWPLRPRDFEKIQRYPATQVLTKEMREGKRQFYVTYDADNVIAL